jgi:hypothetical protein
MAHPPKLIKGSGPLLATSIQLTTTPTAQQRYYIILQVLIRHPHSSMIGADPSKPNFIPSLRNALVKIAPWN